MYGGISVDQPFCLSDCSAWGWGILLLPWFGAWTFGHPVVTCTTPIQLPLYSYSGWAETVEAGDSEPQVTWTNATFVSILLIFIPCRWRQTPSSPHHPPLFGGIALPPVKTQSLFCKHLIRRPRWRRCVSVDSSLVGGSQACQDFGFLTLGEKLQIAGRWMKSSKKSFSFFIPCSLCTSWVHSDELQHGLRFSWELRSLIRNHLQMFTDSFNTRKTQISAT